MRVRAVGFTQTTQTNCIADAAVEITHQGRSVVIADIHIVQDPQGRLHAKVPRSTEGIHLIPNISEHQAEREVRRTIHAALLGFYEPWWESDGDIGCEQ